MSKENDDLRKLIEQGFAMVSAEFKAVQAEFKSVHAEFKSVHAEFRTQGERIARMEGRLDEQSRILAAMIPTTLAAVPSARKEAGNQSAG